VSNIFLHHSRVPIFHRYVERNPFDGTYLGIGTVKFRNKALGAQKIKLFIIQKKTYTQSSTYSEMTFLKVILLYRTLIKKGSEAVSLKMLLFSSKICI